MAPPNMPDATGKPEIVLHGALFCFTVYNTSIEGLSLKGLRLGMGPRYVIMSHIFA